MSAKWVDVSMCFFIFRIGYVYEEYGGDYSDKREEEHDYMQFGMHKDFLLDIAKYSPLLRF